MMTRRDIWGLCRTKGVEQRGIWIGCAGGPAPGEPLGALLIPHLLAFPPIPIHPSSYDQRAGDDVTAVRKCAGRAEHSGPGHENVFDEQHASRGVTGSARVTIDRRCPKAEIAGTTRQ